MSCVIDREKNMTPIKSGFHTGAQANDWAKKNLPKDDVRLWTSGRAVEPWKIQRYAVVRK